MDEDDVDEDDAGRSIEDENPLQRKPEEEFLLGKSLHSLKCAVVEVPSDHLIEVGQAVVNRIAGPLEPNLKETGVPVQVKGLDRLGKEAGLEAVLLEVLVD